MKEYKELGPYSKIESSLQFEKEVEWWQYRFVHNQEFGEKTKLDFQDGAIDVKTFAVQMRYYKLMETDLHAEWQKNLEKYGVFIEPHNELIEKLATPKSLRYELQSFRNLSETIISNIYVAGEELFYEDPTGGVDTKLQTWFNVLVPEQKETFISAAEAVLKMKVSHCTAENARALAAFIAKNTDSAKQKTTPTNLEPVL
ncbi:MAG: hypothetical protein LBL34_05235 [Clostridiales bacterium]|jgi:hypothetical protein|nr:hypothetical protein [Clostridiales bacterium]